MRFRTEIEPLKGVQPIKRTDRIVLLGSCFTDNIGSRLVRDGFDVSVNAMGALYNPLSMAKVITDAFERRTFTSDDLYFENGTFHALDFESRRQGADADALLDKLNCDFAEFSDFLCNADVIIATFGTARIFGHIPTGRYVGNCHKLDSRQFAERRLSVEEIVSLWQPIVSRKRVIFTVSPVRHLADGLHGNNLSKATLLLATEQLGEYFPAYEIVNDDLRDYRFYADDLKHPSETAVDYIYELFCSSYFSPETMREACKSRKEFIRKSHRPIIS